MTCLIPLPVSIAWVEKIAQAVADDVEGEGDAEDG
jgi:hypothetical protein